MRARILSGLRRLRGDHRVPTVESVSEYWNRHNVTGHHTFTTADNSLQFFHWRNSQYANYLRLMPVAGFDRVRILDYGCGPGHDLVGFGTYSRPARLCGVDVSTSSVGEAKARLALHDIPAEVHRIDPKAPLPFEDASFDHVHSSGVLHHVEDPAAVLREIKRVLIRGGSMNVMVYNYNSLWTHLKVAYHRTIREGLYPGLTLREQFARSTDGDDCPIARCYEPEEFIGLATASGFSATFAGAAISMIELSLLPTRFDAIMDPRLPQESRHFLELLEFDRHMLPLSNGHYAGVDGIYHLRS